MLWQEIRNTSRLLSSSELQVKNLIVLRRVKVKSKATTSLGKLEETEDSVVYLEG
jgi:hypothetical protein